MVSGWTLSLIALAYIGLLFAIAFFGDRRGSSRLVSSPWVYALSMAVYCTAWTFYGSVGRAAQAGVGFLPIYLGPTLAAALSWVLLRKMVRISKRERITSIADFVAARYGKSRGLGALVTAVAVVGTVPYLALQLKAVATTFLLLADGGQAAGDQAAFLRTSLAVTAVLALFAILFGTRHVDLTEQHSGLVLAVAFESVVKLVAFLAVGLWVVFSLHDGPAELFASALAKPELARIATFEVSWASWSWMVLLAWSAILFLPRQFQVAVLENVDEEHLRKASWVFPAYLLAINLFVLPIAFAGRLAFDPSGVHAIDADTFVLSLPLAHGQTSLALLVFLGGLSAATGMVIVECVALSTMVANDLVLPLLLRPALGGADPDLGGRLLLIRRLAIVGVLGLGQLYLAAVGIEVSLVSIGLISFAAIAQLAPSILGGLYWQGATRRGAFAGLLGGFAVWAYTLPIPTLIESGYLPASWLTEGPSGISLLRPHALFGLTDLDPISHSMVWSLLANIGGFVVVSSFGGQSAMESRQAWRFVDVFRHGERAEPPLWRADTPVEAIRSLLGRFLGFERTVRTLDAYFEERGLDAAKAKVADAELVGYAERLLAGTTGAASAHLALRSIAEEHSLDADEVVLLLDETARALATSRQLEEKSRQLEEASEELRDANARLRELDRLKDDFLATMTHELRTPLTSIRAFSEILHDNPQLPEEKRREFLAVVLKENERLTRLIGQVLDLAKIESGNLVELSAEEPGSLIDEAVAPFKGLLDERHIQLECRIEKNLPRVEVDRDRVIQVLVNLLANACKFCRQGGLILVEAEQRARAGQVWVEIAVSDDGPGVPPSERETIFDKFRQVIDPGKRPSHGSGLGLAICRGIVERLGGTIWVESSQRGGARFAFTLKAASPSPQKVRSERRASAWRTAS